MAYRIPHKPGYLGAYNWNPIIAAIIAIPTSSFLVSQVIAAHFRYHPELGAAWYRLGALKIYAPFSWAVWAFHYGFSLNPHLSRPVMFGAFAVVLISAVSIGVAGAANGSRFRAMEENLGDLHGTARWAEPADVKASGLLDAETGVYVGGWRESRKAPPRYLKHNGKDHVLAFAPTRSGKGVGLVIPTLLGWDQSVVVYDIKGENWALTAGFRQSCGHSCFKFSPTEEISSRFNPLAEIRLHTPREVSDAQNIAEILLLSGKPDTQSAEHSYFPPAAASIVTGLILHVCYVAEAQGRTACLSDLAELFEAPGRSFRETLLEIERSTTHPTVRRKARQMLNKQGEDFTGVQSTATTALSIFADPLVAANTATSDFRVDDLVKHEKPISLYLVVPPSDKLRLRPLIRLMFTVIVNRLTERMEFQQAQQVKNKHSLLFLIDEFPSLDRMELFADALTYMAGFGLKAYLITQDIRQIEEKYGQHETITSGCNTKIAFAPNHFQTAEHLSEMLGERTIEMAKPTYSGKRSAAGLDNVSVSHDQVRRRLLTPDEIQRLKPALKDAKGERILAPGDMLVFMVGYPPIYGEQMLYFENPIFQQRAAIPPPKDMIAITVDGAVVPQPVLAMRGEGEETRGNARKREEALEEHEETKDDIRDDPDSDIGCYF